MPAAAIGDRFDEGRTIPPSRLLKGGTSHFVDGQYVVAVHLDSLDAVSLSFDGNTLAAGLP